MKILVVDDDQAVRESLRRSLTFNGYTVSLAADGEEALRKIRAEQPNLVILDVMMPVKNGLEVCRQLRSEGDNRPLIMLTARDGVANTVTGIEAGADDYVTKPYALEELMVRVQALLRRTQLENPEPADESVLEFSDLKMVPETRFVTRGEREIGLTRTEFALLELLLRNPRKVLPRNTILEDVWGYDFPTSGNALEVYIGYLRRKTEAGGEDRLIHTVRGVGYVLRESAL